MCSAGVTVRPGMTLLRPSCVETTSSEFAAAAVPAHLAALDHLARCVAVREGAALLAPEPKSIRRGFGCSARLDHHSRFESGWPVRPEPRVLLITPGLTPVCAAGSPATSLPSRACHRESPCAGTFEDRNPIATLPDAGQALASTPTALSGGLLVSSSLVCAHGARYPDRGRPIHPRGRGL